MTGAIQAAGTADGGGLIYSVTVVNFANGNNIYGHSRAGSTGAISPSTYKGGTFSQVLSQVSPSIPFRFELDGTFAQGYFSRLLVQDSTGAWRNLSSASATFIASGGVSSWSYSGSIVWNAAGTRTLIIF